MIKSLVIKNCARSLHNDINCLHMHSWKERPISDLNGPIFGRKTRKLGK